MLKSGVIPILIYSLLCTSTLSARFVLKNTTFTREWSRRTYNPVVLKLSTHLLTVTKSNISINLTSTDSNFEPCQIPVNPDTDHVTSVIKARSLGNRKIVVWGVSSLLDVAKDWRTVNYIVFVVNPQNCSALRLATICEEVPSNCSQYWGSLVTYRDSFDVFFRTQRICSPCRFNDKGERIEVNAHLSLDGNDDGSYVIVDTMNENDPSEGYFYAFQFRNSSVKMKVLNEKFEATGHSKELWARWLDSHSTAKRFTGYCIFYDKILRNGSDHYESPFCYVMDSQHPDIGTSAMTYMPIDGRPAHTTMCILEDGSAWVAVAHVHPRPRPAEIHVQKLKHVSGPSAAEKHSTEAEISEPVDFQRISGNYPFEMQGIMLEDEYCLVTVEKKESAEDYEEPEVSLTVKCMTASD